MELIEPDASGRMRPISMKDSEFAAKINTAVIASGTTPYFLVASTAVGLKPTSHGTAVTDAFTGKTVKDRVWAGGCWSYYCI
jgi:glutamate synthase (NADPH) small chain